MEYNILKHSKALELDKVLSLLAEKASMEETKALCKEIVPSFEIGEVKRLLKQTDDAYLLIAKFGTPSFGFAKNVNHSFKAAAAGGMLTMKSLLEIGELFRVIRSLKEWRESSAGISTSLDEYFEVLTPNKYFEDKIFFSIKNEDEMSDSASQTLSDIRRKLKNAAMNIKDRLDKILRDPKHITHLQEAIVTQRQGRFVVPVKAEHKAQIPGLVHDTSSSGATLFVEPISVVEINNEIKVLQSKEREEIERILSELSVEAATFSASAIVSYEAMVSLDICFAKANLGYSQKASMPSVNSDGNIKFKNARHPLISAKSVVPVTIELGKDYNQLIITGPNTGGKTVSLKTVGLLTLMGCCGLMLPVDDGSSLAVFDGVFADIGDEQSIEQSLSTFSSHMNNIINILNLARQNTLVLFDELCSGTDPVEGAALSTAILKELMERKTTVVATTHYAELKAYALDTPGAQNGCFEFDVETLRPTYRLLIGIPGRSNALEISKRLGLDERLVESAKSLVSAENSRFEELVGKLEAAHTAAKRELAQARAIKSQLEQSKKSTSQRLAELGAEKDKIIEKARAEANAIIEATREKSNRLLNELEDLKKQLNKQNNADVALKARTLAKQSITGLEQEVDSVSPATAKPKSEKPNRPLVTGDIIEIDGFSREGVVESVSDDGKFVFAAIGSIRTKVSINDVSLIAQNKSQAVKKPSTRKVKGITPKSQREVKRELDIRGFACDEGIMEVDRFLDEAVLSGATTVTIIHGKGTGVLKKAVRAHLRNHPSVKTSRPGVYGEGEDGVTVAEIK